jgi:pSer/pThr/pTyr-binding forkhead associated (FHA) protein
VDRSGSALARTTSGEIATATMRVEGSMATLERFGPSGHDLVVLDESRGRLSIGKNETNDLPIADDPAVSRVHAVLEHIGPAWCLTDVGSTNGTYVNGVRLSRPRKLVAGDLVRVGETDLRFEA